MCFPSNKSDSAKTNHKYPTFFVLDSDEPNFFGCSDIYKRVFSYYCYGCPSLNGTIGSCSHLAFLLLYLGAPAILLHMKTSNLIVPALNMRNKFTCLDPVEAIEYTKKGVHFHFNVDKTTRDHRSNCLFYFPQKARIKFALEKKADEEIGEESPYNVPDVEITEVDKSLDCVPDVEIAEVDECLDSVLDVEIAVVDECLDSVPDVEMPDSVPVEISGVCNPPDTIVDVEISSCKKTLLYGRSSSNIENLVAKKSKNNKNLFIPRKSEEICLGMLYSIFIHGFFNI